MINNIFVAFVFVVSLSLIGCTKRDQIIVEGKLPIDSLAEVRLINLMSGQQVFSDTITPSSFRLEIPAIQQGIYMLEIIWNRYQLRPSELKERARYQMEELPKYYLSKALWVDSSGEQYVEISDENELQQHELEYKLFTQSEMLPLRADARQENARVFENFIAIGVRFHAHNKVVRDSIRQKLYTANESGAYGQSKQLNAQVGTQWMEGVKERMQHEEVAYLQRYEKSPIVPYVLYGKVTSKEDFVLYQPVYEALDKPVKEKVGVWFAQYMD
ncbi:hypothetical protein M8998_14340 [Sphingobacterium sp. lm-10]|uniref:hypothetical protein n=1 Tax=Sphingobacterium sp. lm-10 TaxID=2944904 RepID=UPI002021A965|nr:hypothetical protein [Sphingobacterium sp. lm-10]MCL7989124.1 hypothetical protein [Sphingobacterium sp. lm-10]